MPRQKKAPDPLTLTAGLPGSDTTNGVLPGARALVPKVDREGKTLSTADPGDVYALVRLRRVGITIDQASQSATGQLSVQHIEVPDDPDWQEKIAYDLAQLAKERAGQLPLDGTAPQSPDDKRRADELRTTLSLWAEANGMDAVERGRKWKDVMGPQAGPWVDATALQLEEFLRTVGAIGDPRVGETDDDGSRSPVPCPDWSAEVDHDPHTWDGPTDGPSWCPGWPVTDPADPDGPSAQPDDWDAALQQLGADGAGHDVKCEFESCGQRLPADQIAAHLTSAHGVDPADIVDAPTVDFSDTAPDPDDGSGAGGDGGGGDTD